MAAARTPRVAARSRLGPLPLAASLRLPAFLLTHLLRMKPPITPLPARPTTYEPVTATLELAAALAAPQPRRRNPPPQVVRLHGLPVPSTPTLRPLRLALPTPRIKPRLQPRIPRKRRERKPLPAPRAKLVRVVTPARKGHATAVFTQAGFLRANPRECSNVAISKNTALGLVFSDPPRLMRRPSRRRPVAFPEMSVGRRTLMPPRFQSVRECRQLPRY
jgi:hypothetical protein